MIERTKLIATSAKAKGKVDIEYVFVKPNQVTDQEEAEILNQLQ
jgi:hypothetical protein